MNDVHFEQEIMNPNITSKEEILNHCRHIVQTEGLGALTMRHGYGKKILFRFAPIGKQVQACRPR